MLDYRVDEVKILSNGEKQNIINNNNNYKSSDVLALVTYSIKPQNVETSEWAAGNGEDEGEWIINKQACEVFRNNKLNEGLATGW